MENTETSSTTLPSGSLPLEERIQALKPTLTGAMQQAIDQQKILRDVFADRRKREALQAGA
jgi:hypothetical protein